MKAKEQSSQTTFSISPPDEEESKVRCFKCNQTVTQINFDASYERAVLLLEFTPTSEIKKDNLHIINLPKKQFLKFTNDSGSARKCSTIKSNITSVHTPAALKVKRRFFEAGVQTAIRVCPHILDDDQVAVVVKDVRTQTKQSFKPNASDSFVQGALVRPGLLKQLGQDEGTVTPL